MTEIWRDIPGYEGLYQVSNLGNVLSVRSGGLLRPCRNGCGYRKVTLFRPDRKKQHAIHRLVAAAFIPNPESKPHINHINGDKTDNRSENLEWATENENMLHCRRVLNTWCGAPRKRVVCEETGVVYAHAGEAAEAIGASRAGVQFVCSGRNKTIKKLHFRYLEE